MVDRAPYPGLRSFRADESDIFFGRDDCVDAMLDRLAATRFLVVLGSSGIGKSSLVKTGLLSALQMGLARGAGSSWLIVDFRPGQPEGSPLRNLARGLLDKSGQPVTPENISRIRTQFMREGPRALLNWCRAGHLPAGTNLLLLVDQFEELFRYQDYSSYEEAEAFVALLLESRQPLEAGSPATAEFPIYVTLTMRSEFLGACSLIQNLPDAITKGAFLTPRMTRDQYREAIVGPADVCDIGIDERLVNRMLNDLAAFAPWDEKDPGQPGAAPQANPVEAQDQVMRLARRADQLPVLQHALNRMWRRACERGATGSAGEGDGAAPAVELTVADYEAVGGLENALNAHAEAVLGQVSTQVSASASGGAERTAQRVFRALATGVTPSEAVRRPTRLTELSQIAEDERGVRAIVEAFRADECNFLMPEPAIPLTPDTMVDISHESLIRQWKRLAQWVGVEAAAAQQWRRLNDRFNMGEPLRGRTLENFVAWRDETLPNAAWARRYGGAAYDAVIAFLGRSERAEKNRRWIRNAAIAGSFAFLVLVAGGMTLLWRSVVAERNRAQAAERSAQAAERSALQISIDTGEVATTAREKFSDIADTYLDSVGDTISWAPPSWAAYLHRQKAFAADKNGDYAAARKEIDLARKADPDYLPALVTSSDLYLIEADAVSAERDAGLYLQTVKTDSTVRGNLIVAQAMQGKYDEAIRQIGEALTNARLPIASSDSFVLPDIQTFTHGFTLSESDTDFLLALRYTKAFLYAMKGDDSFRNALEDADKSDRDCPYSRNAYLAALNWGWLIVRGRARHDMASAQTSGDARRLEEPVDYGAYAIEGALWERVARTRPQYHAWALSAFAKFQTAYRSHPQERYKSIAAWVDAEAGKPLQEAPPEDTIVDRARALAQRAQELKAPAGTHAINFVPAFAQLSAAIDLLTPKPGVVPGRRQQDLLIDLLLRRADWRLQGGTDEIDRGGAADDARAVIKLDPDVPDAYRVLAAAAYDDAARKANDEHALALEPYNPSALKDLATLIQNDDPQTALALLQKFQRVRTAWSSDYALLARLQTRLGNHAQALREIDNAIARAPWELDYYAQRRDIEQKMGVDPAALNLHLAQGWRTAASYAVRTGDDGLALERYLHAFMTVSGSETPDAEAKFEMERIVRDLSELLATNYSRADAELFWQSLSLDPLLNSFQKQVAAQELARLSGLAGNDGPSNKGAR